MSIIGKILLTGNLALSPVPQDLHFIQSGTDTPGKVYTLLTDGKTGILSEGEFVESGVTSVCKSVIGVNGNKVIVHIITKKDALAEGDSDFEEMLPDTQSENTEVFDITPEVLRLINASADCKLQDRIPGDIEDANLLY